MAKMIEINAGDTIEHHVGRGWVKVAEGAEKQPCTPERNIVAIALSDASYPEGEQTGLPFHAIARHDLRRYWRDRTRNQIVGQRAESEEAHRRWLASGYSMGTSHLPQPRGAGQPAFAMTG